MFTNGHVEQLAMPSKLCWIVALLLVLMASWAGMACQFHPTPFVNEFTAPNQQPVGPSAHSRLDFCCVTAILSITTLFFLLVVSVFPVTPQLLSPVAPVFPPFIPPRYSIS